MCVCVCVVGGNICRCNARAWKRRKRQNGDGWMESRQDTHIRTTQMGHEP